VTADGRLRGWVGGSCAEPAVRREALRALTVGTPCLVRIQPAELVEQTRRPGELTIATTCPSAGSLDVFIEPMLPRPLLLVFGDSPAAHTLVELGAVTGFRTCAVHPGGRPEDHPRADMVLSSLELAPAAPGADSWAVVATMGHYDEDALEACLAYAAVEVGLVASGRRAEAVREELRRRGLDEQTISRIRTPAGAVRGANQEEIALFALAEVVSARRALLREASEPLGDPDAAAAGRFATDPVCGMVVEIDSALSGLHDGKRLYFCSEVCRQSFQGADRALAGQAESG
jgi:xanthine dehydrogenase accessory factor